MPGSFLQARSSTINLLTRQMSVEHPDTSRQETLQTLVSFLIRLALDEKVSLDWLLLGKGPMHRRR